MLGFSPTKLLFTVLIIAAVWYGFKWFNRMQNLQNKRAQTPQQSNNKSQAAQNTSTDAEYEDLVACPKCGDYVLAGKKCGCGKEGCPHDK